MTSNQPPEGTGSRENESPPDPPASSGAGMQSLSHEKSPSFSHSFRPQPDVTDHASRVTSADSALAVDEGDIAPPPYSEVLGHIVEDTNALGTNASVAQDGRVNIRINQRSRRLSTLIERTLRPQVGDDKAPPPPYIPPSLGGVPGQLPPPPMNVVIMVVGSRGDIQPFVALGKVLKDTYGHRVRLATHPVFKDFIQENGLEFFSIGGDPAELMAFMVKNPGLMPGWDTLRSGDVGKRRKGIAELISGCWRACFEAGDGTGVAVNDATVEEWMSTDTTTPMSADAAAAQYGSPFVADCIIANPPSFAHIHCAERLGIPLHIMFTMPWSPTQAFPHPLANIQSSDADVTMSNFISYALVDMLTWQGLGDVINSFRLHTLGLEPVSLIWAPGILSRLRVPHTYCWSPALIPKPADWGAHISISGFYFLSLASNYTPAPDLAAFLEAGPPPVYIGFGSIVVDDPNAMTKMIFEAVEKTGQRALVSKGWGGIGADEIGIPDNVFMLGNVPHDWLFHKVSCVVHHGGAGTTAAGIACGRPTVIVPFFGDQPFWGAMVAKAGAGPTPIAYKHLTADKLAASITEALKPSSLERAKELSEKISSETGTEKGAQYFHQMLDVDDMRCSLLPEKTAVWRVKRTKIRLSALAAYSLAEKDLISYDDLKLYRPREYETDLGPVDPVSGGATAVMGGLTTFMMGVADLPVETLKALSIHPDVAKAKEAARARKQSEADQVAIHSPGPGGASSSTVGSSERLSKTTTQGSTASDSTNYLETSSTISSVNSRSMISSETDKTPTEEPLSYLTTAHDSIASPAAGRSSSMADALHSLSDQSRPRSPSGTRSGSPSRMPSRHRHGSSHLHNHSSPSPSRAPIVDPLDTIYGTGKGISKIIGSGLKAPLDFTVALSKGFHNVPRLYGEEVRQVDRVTGMHSGLRTAGKEFGRGMFDGITGLVTQPLMGAKKEGAAGFLKGMGRGIAGIIVKPGAGLYALPAYVMMGVYKEIQRKFGDSVQGYIIAARVAQGYGDWLQIEEDQKRDIVQKWASCLSEVKGKRGLGKDKEKDACGLDSIKAFVDKRQDKRKLRKGTAGQVASEKRTPSTTSLPFAPATASGSVLTPSASRGSIPAELSETTSHSNTEQDDTELEEAIRLSLRIEPEEGEEAEDEDLKRAIQASLNEMKHEDEGHDEDEHLESAIQASVSESAAPQTDEDLQLAIEESKKHVPQTDEELRLAIEESNKHATPQTDEELRLAIEESKKHGDEEERQRKEEEIVLEYIKKQSLAEEEFRKQKQ